MWTEEQRRIYRREGDGYPGDLRNTEWARLEPLIPSARPGGRPRKTDMWRSAKHCEETFAGAAGNDRDAPSPAIRRRAGTRRDADRQRPLTALPSWARHLCNEALERRARRVTNRIRSPR